MIVPSLDGPKNPTIDDVKQAGEECNKMGAQLAKAGIQQGLHNEEFELSLVDSKRTDNLLLDLPNPMLVKFQFQVSTISRGSTRSISRSTLGASFPRTYKAGRRKPKK